MAWAVNEWLSVLVGIMRKLKTNERVIKTATLVIAARAYIYWPEATFYA
jgi:hypothetical protein